ncbi:MAG TPA: hypothetical protein VER03_03240 [Bryobacteraceae bacterium]|nr:hypothetical protein [Bryobacteraceae bacterium]
MSEMNCRCAVESFIDYAEAELGTEQVVALQRHLAKCPRCVEFLEAYRATSGIVQRALSLEPAPEVRDRLRTRVLNALGL